MIKMTRLIPFFLLLALPDLIAAQRASSVLGTRAAAPSTGGAFVVEGLGAAAGSLVGFGLVYMTRDDCDVEDLGCNIGKAGLGLVTSTAGAALGATLVGNLAETNPSGWGAVVGAMAGAAAGVGAWHLFTEELDISNSPTVAILTYSAVQGVLTAVGSRIGASLRN